MTKKVLGENVRIIGCRQMKKARKRDFRKTMNCSIAVALCIVLCISILQGKMYFVKAEQGRQNLDLSQLFCVRQLVIENGQTIYRGSDSDMRCLNDGFSFQLENTDTVQMRGKNEGDKFVSSETIYSSGAYRMSSAQNLYSGMLIAEKDVYISGNASKLDGGSIYSKGGNVFISGNRVEIHGIVYAPAGKLNISCETLILKGMLIADLIEIHARECHYGPDKIIQQKVGQMEEYRVDSYTDITMYYNNEKGKIGIEDIEGHDISLYTRYGNGEFQLQKEYENGMLFDVPESGEYFEAYAEFTNQYGERKISDIETFGATEEGLYCKLTQDEDKDGIPDGYEVRDGLGNPEKFDTDQAGMSDGEAVLLYGKRHALGYLEGNLLVEDAVGQKLRKTYGDRLVQKGDNQYRYLVKAGDCVTIYFNEDGKKIISVYNYILEKEILECVEDAYRMQCYDLDGNTLVRLAHDGENQIYHFYTYNQNGVDHVVHNDMEYSYKYDKRGQMKDVSMNGESMFSLVWENDRKCIQKMANGFRYIKEYNKENQMIRVSSDEGVLYEWRYADEKPYHLLKHIDYVNDLEYRYQYDDQGEVSKVSCSDGTSYAMDQGVTEWGIKTVDENGKEKETYQISGDDYVYTNGSVKATSNESEQHVYADGQKISTVKVIRETDQKKEIKQNDSLWKYVYDEQGLLKELWKDNDLSCRYEYNNMNELIREDSLLTGKTVRYHYDGGGNLQNVVSYPLDMEQETEELANGTVESRYFYDQEFPDRLVSFQGKDITYDKMGNPLKYWNGYWFSWTQGQKLESISDGDRKYEYSYDMEGYRMSKVVDGVKTCFSYQNGALVMEKSSDNKMRYHYDASGNLLYFDYGDKQYYYELDDHKSVVGILDHQGKRLVSYEYDAWGKLVQISGNQHLGNRNPFRYRSYYYDRESGFYYLHHRYYDPVVRRMLNMDQYTDTQFGMFSHNMYAYCENTPVNASNYSGNVPEWVKKLKVSPSRKNYLWKTNSIYNTTNCYGYAVKYQAERPIQPGKFSERKFTFSNIKSVTLADLKKKHKHAKEITVGESISLSAKHIVIALRTGTLYNGSKDYHFMRRVYDSKTGGFIWTHKPGTGWGGVLIHKHLPGKLKRWHYEYYDNYGDWVFRVNGGYTSSVTYFAYWD